MVTAEELQAFTERTLQLHEWIANEWKAQSNLEWVMHDLAVMEGRRDMVKRARLLTERLYDVPAIRGLLCEDGLPNFHMLDDLDLSTHHTASLEERMDSIRWIRDRHELRLLLEGIDACDGAAKNAPETAGKRQGTAIRGGGGGMVGGGL